MNIKHIILILTVLAAAAVSASAQSAAPAPNAAESGSKSSEQTQQPATAADYFLRLPVDVLEVLPRSARFDMLEYFKVDSVYKAVNSVEGMSWLTAVTPDFLEVRISDVSTLQLRILPFKKDSHLVMTVYTVGGDGQAADSDVRFFDAELNPLERKKFLKELKLKDFFDIPKGSVTTMKEIEQTIPFPTVEYSASAADTSLKAKLTVKEYLNQDDYNVIHLFEKPEIIYVWDGTKYKLH